MSAKNLVIVESPAKSKTISKYLGPDFTIKASMGHIRDLPGKKSELTPTQQKLPYASLAINTDKDFEPLYVVTPTKKKVVKELKSLIDEDTVVWLAADEDREWEAIAFHLQEALGLNKKTNKNTVHRVTFNEITKPAILNAFDHPRHIDMDLVNAQQARRVIDRLVGYGLSPLLWKKIRFGLSAGRVQSVAVKIVVDREKEIQAFNPEEYWTLEGTFLTKGNESIVAKLTQEEGKKIELKSGQQTQKVLDAIEGQPANITDMSSKNRKKKPAAPFITSTLQQAASSRMGWSVKKTMQVAQKLYEGIGEYGGLITYMRTDSNNLSKTATDQARDIIGKEYGADYLPKTAISYGKKSKNAQEAHEAIRPTDFSKKPGTLPKLNEDQARLYDLIWKRAIASQMSDAQFLQTGINIGVANYTFRATGQQLVFPGFLTVYVSGDDKDQLLPKLENNETLVTEKYDPEQHYTKPPARYNEASLVKKMEEEGIGRPSTYAPTITTIQSRGYIQKEGAQLIPTEVAFVVTKLLEGHFEDIVSLGFTAGMEDKLDEVAEWKAKWVPLLHNFYTPFKKRIADKDVELKKEDLTVIETLKIPCPKCGSDLVKKLSKFGSFASCSKYPECEFAGNITETGEVAEQEEQKDTILGKHPDTDEEILAKDGPYGPYVQMGTTTGKGKNKKKAKMVSIIPPFSKDTLTLDQALQLLSLPRILGQDKDGNEISVNNGRYGPYLQKLISNKTDKEKKDFRSIPADGTLFAIELQEALKILAQPKTRRKK